ncbi:hypothetical protein HZS_1970 [Henneguya salminicola]|nr:hypothetical protein HZS_1970 [Henneguya salminicola]
MECLPASDLMSHIHLELFSETRTIFYSACVVLGLEFLHDHWIAYRDLKLDNLLMGADGFIKIGDFGLCKIGMGPGIRTRTFCGTPEFIAPEMLETSHYTREVDWWTFGVLLYEMLTGEPPFNGDTEDDIFKAISCQDITFPPYLLPDSLDILSKLLVKNPQLRLGSDPEGANQVKQHPFFSTINFDDLFNKRIKPEYIPKFTRGQATYIEEEYLRLELAFPRPPRSLGQLTSTQQNFFDQFYYTTLE